MDSAPDDPARPPPPGAPAAVARGCRCPVLANASYRVGAELNPLLAPDCAVHRAADPPQNSASPEGSPTPDAGGFDEDRP